MNPATQSTPLLIIGAGPFGLALAAQARALDIDHLIVGTPMSFWRDQMPRGMHLRSAADWHLDPTNRATLDAFFSTAEVAGADTSPLKLTTYLDYARWFQEQHAIAPLDHNIERLDYDHDARRYQATAKELSIEAQAVVVAVGFGYFASSPRELPSLLNDRACHSRDVVNPVEYAGKRVLIVGGRQSAFETAALLAEAGATSVDIVYRHDTPSFEPSDWSWVGPLIERFEDEPGWYAALSDADRAALGRRFWTEGRLKLEPWLAPRLETDRIRFWPRNEVVSGRSHPDGAVEIGLSTGDSITIDRAIFATGYQPDLTRVPFLAAGNLMDALATRNGFPILDHRLQSSLPGLFFTSMLAVQDFGPFFAFTVSARTSARIIAVGVQEQLRSL